MNSRSGCCFFSTISLSPNFARRSFTSESDSPSAVVSRNLYVSSKEIVLNSDVFLILFSIKVLSRINSSDAGRDRSGHSIVHSYRSRLSYDVLELHGFVTRADIEIDSKQVFPFFFEHGDGYGDKESDDGRDPFHNA